MSKSGNFKLDYTKLKKGFYVSRYDCGVITYDMRVRTPYKDELLMNDELNSLSSMLDTYMREDKNFGDKVVYVGPTGCQTGFNVIMSASVSPAQALICVKNALKKIIEHKGPMANSDKEECGNYYTLSVVAAKDIATEYYETIKDQIAVKGYTEEWKQCQ